MLVKRGCDAKFKKKIIQVDLTSFFNNSIILAFYLIVTPISQIAKPMIKQFHYQYEFIINY